MFCREGNQILFVPPAGDFLFRQKVTKERPKGNPSDWVPLWKPLLNGQEGRGVKQTCRWHVFSLRPQRLCCEEGTWFGPLLGFPPGERPQYLFCEIVHFPPYQHRHQNAPGARLRVVHWQARGRFQGGDTIVCPLFGVFFCFVFLHEQENEGLPGEGKI